MSDSPQPASDLSARRFPGDPTHRWLPFGSIGLSLALAIGLFLVFLWSRSQLALAQAADSFSDVFTASVLAFTMFVARAPQDENHPFGHHRAEPLGALVAAIMAGVLAFEVVRSSIDALLTGSRPRLEWLVAGIFGAKIVGKLAVAWLGRRSLRRTPSPAIEALVVDARNDVLVNAVALAGFFGAKAGHPALDAWLALPTGAWIGYAGFRLARENIRLLMGEAPDEQRRTALLALARGVSGVVDAHDLRAHYIGPKLQVLVHIVVDQNLKVRDAHDIGEAVRVLLESEPDVQHVSVHIDSE